MTREPTEMEMRVAEAIATAYERGQDSHRLVPHELSPEQRGKMFAKRWLPEAGAAIQAMREPTEEMVDAPWRACVQAGDYTMNGHEAREAWQAMIDAASPPQ